MRTIPVAMVILLAACTTPQERALHKGNAHYRADRFLDAAQAYGKVPDDPRLLYNEGNAHYRAHDWDKAVDRFSTAARSWDTADAAALAFHNLGNARLMQARHADSLSRRALEEANGLRMDGDDIANNVKVYLMRDSLRNTHRRLDHLVDSALAEGAEAYRHALRRAPADEDARHNLAAALRLIAARPRNTDQGKGNDERDKELTQMARQFIHQADSLVDLYRFNDALQLLQQGLQKEPSLKSRQDYMDKLATVNKAAGNP